MSTNPNVEKAQKMLTAAKSEKWPYRPMEWSEIAAARDAAGLLVTPLHERALAHCEKWGETEYPQCSCESEAHAIGCLSLAAKEAAKPKERWVARISGKTSSSWCVSERAESPWTRPFQPSIGGLTKPQAEAVAKALNEVDK